MGGADPADASGMGIHPSDIHGVDLSFVCGVQNRTWDELPAVGMHSVGNTHLEHLALKDPRPGACFV